MVRSQEAFNFYSHLTGMVAAAFGTLFLVMRAATSESLLIPALIYGLSTVFLFLASSLYHAFKQQENEASCNGAWLALVFSRRYSFHAPRGYCLP